MFHSVPLVVVHEPLMDVQSHHLYIYIILMLHLHCWQSCNVIDIFSRSPLSSFMKRIHQFALQVLNLTVYMEKQKKNDAEWNESMYPSQLFDLLVL